MNRHLIHDSSSSNHASSRVLLLLLLSICCSVASSTTLTLTPELPLALPSGVSFSLHLHWQRSCEVLIPTQSGSFVADLQSSLAVVSNTTSDRFPFFREQVYNSTEESAWLAASAAYYHTELKMYDVLPDGNLSLIVPNCTTQLSIFSPFAGENHTAQDMWNLLVAFWNSTAASPSAALNLHEVVGVSLVSNVLSSASGGEGGSTSDPGSTESSTGSASSSSPSVLVVEQIRFKLNISLESVTSRIDAFRVELLNNLATSIYTSAIRFQNIQPTAGDSVVVTARRLLADSAASNSSTTEIELLVLPPVASNDPSAQLVAISLDNQSKDSTSVLLHASITKAVIPGSVSHQTVTATMCSDGIVRTNCADVGIPYATASALSSSTSWPKEWDFSQRWQIVVAIVVPLIALILLILLLVCLHRSGCCMRCCMCICCESADSNKTQPHPASATIGDGGDVEMGGTAWSRQTPTTYVNSHGHGFNARSPFRETHNTHGPMSVTNQGYDASREQYFAEALGVAQLSPELNQSFKQAALSPQMAQRSTPSHLQKPPQQYPFPPENDDANWPHNTSISPVKHYARSPASVAPAPYSGTYAGGLSFPFSQQPLRRPPPLELPRTPQQNSFLHPPVSSGVGGRQQLPPLSNSRIIGVTLNSPFTITFNPTQQPPQQHYY